MELRLRVILGIGPPAVKAVSISKALVRKLIVRQLARLVGPSPSSNLQLHEEGPEPDKQLQHKKFKAVMLKCCKYT